MGRRRRVIAAVAGQNYLSFQLLILMHSRQRASVRVDIHGANRQPDFNVPHRDSVILMRSLSARL